ncbi:hypothetical protein CR513_05437, partial [Mucuna pruriens]
MSVFQHLLFCVRPSDMGGKKLRDRKVESDRRERGACISMSGRTREARLPLCSITSFAGLAAAFESRFAANKTKHLEVVDLFDIKQTKTETLMQYLIRFNEAMVQVHDIGQNFFVKAFQKGLRVDPFNDSLALSRDENHVEVKEDKKDHLLVEKAMSAVGRKITHKP